MTATQADPRRLDRLRWKARRGLLENDLILTKFLEKDLENLSEAELNTLDQLLQLGDNDLLDVLMGRKVGGDIKIDVATAALVTKILNA
jgi:antitoxin CptB